MPPVFDADPMLRRLERFALAFCAVAAVAALVLRGGQPDVALGILGGGLLTAISYGAIRSSVTGILAFAYPERPPTAAGGDPAGASPEGGEAVVLPPGRASLLVRIVGRYALLGLVA